MIIIMIGICSLTVDEYSTPIGNLYTYTHLHFSLLNVLYVNMVMYWRVNVNVYELDYWTSLAEYWSTQGTYLMQN